VLMDLKSLSQGRSIAMAPQDCILSGRADVNDWRTQEPGMVGMILTAESAPRIVLRAHRKIIPLVTPDVTVLRTYV